MKGVRWISGKLFNERFMNQELEELLQGCLVVRSWNTQTLWPQVTLGFEAEVLCR